MTPKRPVFTTDELVWLRQILGTMPDDLHPLDAKMRRRLLKKLGQ